jgi:hypothetical protein
MLERIKEVVSLVKDIGLILGVPTIIGVGLNTIMDSASPNTAKARPRC